MVNKETLEIISWLRAEAEEAWQRSQRCYSKGLFDIERSKLLQHEYAIIKRLADQIEYMIGIK